MKRMIILASVVSAVFLQGAWASAQSTTSFTYQGELRQNGSPANGSFNMEFALENTTGTQLDVMTVNGVQVVDGRFSVELDFGSETFNLFNQDRYLQIEVNGTTLSPRTLITRAPYALQTRGIRVNEDASFVGIGRDERITFSEVFGLYSNTTDFGGMYIETENGGSPFYGYSTTGGTEAYHYFDDSSAVWRLNIFGEDLLNVAFNGNVGLGTASPAAPLHVQEGSTGVSAQGNSTAVFERSGQNFVSILSPDSSERGILFGDPENLANGGIVYNNASNPDGLQFRTGGNVNRLAIDDDGTVVIANNGMLVTPVLQITGGSDFSEMFDVGGDTVVLPGMVVVIDPDNPGRLIPSTTTHDRKVAGIISGAGGVATGMTMGHDGTIADGKYPVALSGRVYCLVDATQSAVEPGDMLTTSATRGHAMKVIDVDAADGAVLGKAMTSLAKGEVGLVLVLVNLQ